METMKAAVIHRRGTLDDLKVEQVPIPEVAPDGALVRVHACGFNHKDIWALKGKARAVFPWKEREYPLIVGGDVVGEVAAVGSEVTGVQPGQRVILFGGLSCGDCEFCLVGEQSMCLNYKILTQEQQGGFAEYISVPAAQLEPLPDSIDWVHGAAIAAGFTTAWRLVQTAGEVTAGDDVLILAAGGGVGVAAMQIALRAGARVFAGASTEAKRQRAIELGATAGVDTTKPFSQQVLELTDGRGVDIVVDSLGATWKESIRSLKPGGRLVCCGATLGDNPDIDVRELYQRHRQIRGAPFGNRNEFRRVVRMIGQGLLTPIVDSVYPLDRIHDAYRRAESREAFGKIVITMS